MSRIFIIAGPPGIGKTTSGYKFIDSALDIINEDEMRFKYREQGYPDFNEQAIHRVSEIIRTKLIRNEDFAFELNLGFAEHYDYVLSAKKFNSGNSLNVILFHTDNLEMCLKRAAIRYESGRHLVKPETVKEMYKNTIPLLKSNFTEIDNLAIINVKAHDLSVVAQYSKAKKALKLLDDQCSWFNEELLPFVKQFNTGRSNSPDLQ